MITRFTANYLVKDPFCWHEHVITTAEQSGEHVRININKALNLLRHDKLGALFLWHDDGTMTRVVKERDVYVLRHYTFPATDSWDNEQTMDSAVMGRTVRAML